MQKVDVNSLEIAETIYKSPYSHVFTVVGDQTHVAKIVSKTIRGMYGVSGTSYEEKITIADSIVGIPEIYKPTAAIYCEGECIGYLQKLNEGMPYTDYELSLDNRRREDLYRYADIYTKLERIVRKGHEQGIIFPDLLTLDNVYIDKDGNISLIDFDGLQIRDKRCISISSFLGTEYSNSSSKFFDTKTGLWTEELDKKSLLYFYFLNTLGLDLSLVGTINPATGNIIKLRDVLPVYGIHDERLIAKIERIMSCDKTGDYFGSAVYDIANKYNLISVPSPIEDDVCYKTLSFKR